MGTVTFFFADQVGPTVQLERLGDAGAKWPVRAVGAVNCAVVVQRQAARHNARHPDDQALGVRVGIDTGEPLVNDEGGDFGYRW
jgi:class 3 adenylate cyclase